MEGWQTDIPGMQKETPEMAVPGVQGVHMAHISFFVLQYASFGLEKQGAAVQDAPRFLQKKRKETANTVSFLFLVRSLFFSIHCEYN